jgi:hypothetical protein
MSDAASPVGDIVASEPYFPYDRIAPYQDWRRAVSDVPDRRTIVPQGPAKFTLPREARVASAGSCFAARVGERLRTVGLNYLVVEAGAEPLSARYGDVYTALQLAQLFDRALGRFEPLERAWLTPSGALIDPFRPRAKPDGYPTLEALEADRRGHLEAVRGMFHDLDVFIFTLGLTEVWTDVRDGAAFPSCPGRGRGYFDPDRYAWRNLGVAETSEQLERFVAALHEINPTAKVLFTVSPVHNAATMHPTHVVRASLECKASLKIAAEAVARCHDFVDYYASYDLVMQNVGGEQFFAADGRHVTDATADIVTQGFIEHYFGERVSLGDPPAPKAPPVDAVAPAASRERSQSLGAECDEDVLLDLIHAADAIPVRSSAVSRQIAHPSPIYFVGDSNSVIYRDRIFELPGSDRRYLGRTLHTPALGAVMLCGSDGALNPNLVTALVGEQLLIADGLGGWTKFERGLNQGLKILRKADERERDDPPVVLFCGSFDQWRIIEELGTHEIRIPSEIGLGPSAPARADALSFEDGVALAMPYVAPLEHGLRILRSAGLRIFLHSLAPPVDEHASLAGTLQLGASYAQRCQVGNLIRHLMREICERTGTIFIDVWPPLAAGAAFDALYMLDHTHLNLAGALFAIDAVDRALHPVPAA